MTPMPGRRLLFTQIQADETGPADGGALALLPPLNSDGQTG